MTSARSAHSAFAALPAIGDLEERRRVTRHALAMLAQVADREPAPLEGIPADALMHAVRTALADGLLDDLTWLAPSAAAVALFELSQALPPCTERRELGRRVLQRLRIADRDTFVRVLVALARSSPRLLAGEMLRARAEVVLSSPLAAAGGIGDLAIGLLAQPALAQSWVEQPATGALPGRRLAARVLAHGAREAVRRHANGDRGGVAILARPGLRAALARLLADREALVWRFAGIARGHLAHVDSQLADDIDRELRRASSSTVLRRAATSAATALERGGAALGWQAIMVERARREPAVARGAILGLAGLAMSDPPAADALATLLVQLAPLDAVDSVAELRRDERALLLPRATAASLAWTRAQLGAKPTHDDGHVALLMALDHELATGVATEGIGIPIATARAALDAGDLDAALRATRVAVDEVMAAADWLERASDDDPLDRRHSMRLLRELDRELLADNTLSAVLALAPELDPIRAQLAAALAAIESSLLAREVAPEAGAVAHGDLRVARLRALVRLLDGVRTPSEAELVPRLGVLRQLMARAAADTSSLRRAVWAALTRAGDSLLRDGHAEITDLMLAWAMAFPDDDFAIVREASMVPEVEAAFAAYAALHAATRVAIEADDGAAVRAVVGCLGELADALPPEQSPRVESVRLAIARLGNQLATATAAASRSALPREASYGWARGAFDAIALELGALARRAFGARQRLGLTADDHRVPELELATRAVGDALLREDLREGVRERVVDDAMVLVIDAMRALLPPAITAALERVLGWLVRRPLVPDAAAVAGDGELPGWVPLSRLVGSFYVLRPIGRGAGGSVLLGVRAEERARADREEMALKVPDYSGEAARNLTEVEFEALFREEAGALLALPAHANLARFITFDASAQPKPVLVMEFVRGTNLERVLEGAPIGMPRALGIIDGLLAGLDAMHRVQIAHLDVKPANVVLRDGTGVSVLVDFGLAGRRIRAGCGSAHYGAAEVWLDGAGDPFPTDVYAATCVAYELLTGEVLVGGADHQTTLRQILDEHASKQPGAVPLARLERTPRLRPLVELLRAGASRDPRRRPSAARLRAGFAAIAPDLLQLPWPLVPWPSRTP